jgi:hypothetical protein
MSFENRNFRIDNVQLNWAKLDRPVEPFGTPQWEVQALTTDKKLADNLAKEHFNVKEKDGNYVISLKRKALKRDGTPNKPPQVVDSKLQPMDPKVIGNGSIGNIMVYQYEYDMMGRQGIGTMLSGVQVTTLNKYNPSASGFDVIGDAEESVDDTEEAFF